MTVLLPEDSQRLRENSNRDSRLGEMNFCTALPVWESKNHDKGGGPTSVQPDLLPHHRGYHQ